MKNKKKDYYLKLSIKKSFFISLVIIALGVLFTFLINNRLEGKKAFLKNAIKVPAIITNIEYKFLNDKEKIEKVYVKYNVNNKIYTGILSERSSNMYVGKNIDIYYNPMNPQEFIQNNALTNNILKYTGYCILVLGVVSLIKAIKELILYISTLNARVVEAKIERVIEKESGFYTFINKCIDFLETMNLNKNGAKKVTLKIYVIECIWEDEKGDKYIFYSKKYDEPYFLQEFEKINLKTLNVRFKNKKKYIVITEEIDKKLME